MSRRFAMGHQDQNGERSVHGFVSGRVQGVGFRWFVLQAARRSGVAGNVRNLRDGRVEFRASGDTASVNDFLDAVRQGPAAGRVDGLEIDETADPGATHGHEFEIL